MNTYLIKFYLKSGNGYALINACNPNQALSMLLNKGMASYDNMYSIVSILEIPYIDLGCSLIIAEGVTSDGLSAYDIAVKYGFKGTEEDWIRMQSTKGVAEFISYTPQEGSVLSETTSVQKAIDILALMIKDLQNQ